MHSSNYEGQTFCMRAMFTAFMGDASNVMSFYEDVDDSVGYAVEWWIFKPQLSGQQVKNVSVNYGQSLSFKFAMVIIKTGDSLTDREANVFKNIVEMDEIILPFKWHSFCISIDPSENNMKLYHNNHIQAIQDFTMTHADKKGFSKLMTKGHLGGPKFVGYLTDFQIFGSALSKETILEWTSCRSKVSYLVFYCQY